jgi:hypothetical protein
MSRSAQLFVEWATGEDVPYALSVSGTNGLIFGFRTGPPPADTSPCLPPPRGARWRSHIEGLDQSRACRDELPFSLGAALGAMEARAIELGARYRRERSDVH